MKKLLLLFAIGFITISANAINYTWVGGTAPAGVFTAQTNWSTLGVGGAPVGGSTSTFITFTNADVLTINGSNYGGGATGTITVAPFTSGSSIAIGQLIFTSNAAMIITNNSGTRGYNIGGGLSGADLDIQAGCTLIFGAAGTGSSAQTMTIVSGNTAVIAGILDIGNKAGSATVFTIGTAGNATVTGTGTYRHGVVSGTIPIFNWNQGATMEYTGLVGTAAGASGNQTYWNVIWNCTAQSGSLGLAGVLTTINGDFTVKSTNNQQLRLNSATSTTTVGGNLNITGGILCLNSGSPSSNILNVKGNCNISSGTLAGNTANNTGAPVINVFGDLNLSGTGILDYQLSGNTVGSANVIVNLSGNLNMSGTSTLTKTSTQAGATLNFNRAGIQNFTKTGGTISAGGVNGFIFNVNSGSILDMGTSILNGTNPGFTVTAGGGVMTANATGLTGSVTLTAGSIAFNAGVYIYNAAGAQATGAALTTASNLVVCKDAVATLSASTAVSTAASVSGSIILGANTNNISGAGTFTLAGNTPLSPTLSNATTVSTTANGAVVTGVNQIVLTTVVGVTVGMLVTGTNVPANTYVTTITGNTIFMSANNSGGITNGATITLTPGNQLTLSSGTGVVPGMLVAAATGIPANTYVTSVSGAVITISKRITATIANAATITLTPAGSITTSSTTGLDGNITAVGTKTFTSGANYTFNAATTVPFSSSQASVIANNLTLGAAITLQKTGPAVIPVTVNGTLALTSGKLTTGTANQITIGKDGIITGSPTNWVIGSLAKILTGTNPTYTFEIGSDATKYTPVTTALTGTITGGVLQASTVGSDHPSIAGSSIDAGINANRYWTLTPTAIVGLTSYNATFTFINPGDLDGPAVGVENTFIVDRFSPPTPAAGTWLKPTVGTRTSTSTQATGLTSAQFGDFVVGEAKNNTPTFNNGADEPLSVCNGTANINSLLAVSDADAGQTLTWSISSGPSNGSLGGFDATAASNAGSVTPAGLTYTPAGVGADAFTIQISDGTGSSTIVINVTTTANTWTGAVNSDWTIPGNWSCGVPTANAQITIPIGNPILNTPFEVGPSGSLVLSGTSTFEIGSLGDLSKQSGGTINFGGRPVTVHSNFAGTGSIGQILGSPIANATNVTVERFIPGSDNNPNAAREWRMLSAATSGQSIRASWQESQTAVSGLGTIITTDNANWAANGFDAQTPRNSLLTYTNGSGAWTGFTGNLNTKQVASEQGYMIFIRGDRTAGVNGSAEVIPPGPSTRLRTTGTLFQGPQGPTGGAGAQIVGNRYASRIDFTQIAGGLTSFSVWDPKLTGAKGLGAFVTFSSTAVPAWSPSIGGGSYTSGVANTFIESGEAFIIQNGSVTLTEASKESGSAMVFRPVDNGLRAQFKTSLYTMSNTGWKPLDGNSVVFADIYANAVDGDDALKITNFGENFGILVDNQTLVIEGRQLISTQEEAIQFRMWNMKSQQYKLEFGTTNLNTAGLTAFLEDKYLGTSKAINLDAPAPEEFTVDANAGSYAADRFRVVFRPAVVVPVRFTTLKAFQKNADIQVEWKVAAENGISQYEVEHSINGRNFTKAGTVAAANAASYSWLDVSPAAGTHYYRIRSIGTAGDNRYTSIVKVLIGKGKTGITVYPNPVKDGMITLQFNNQQAGKYGIKLVSSTGQEMYRATSVQTGGNSSQTYSLPKAMAKGIYKLEIIAPDNKTSVQKVIVN